MLVIHIIERIHARGVFITVPKMPPHYAVWPWLYCVLAAMA